ncbi:MAG: ATP-binding protein [Zoogloeaceae bacterium]|jgi:molecular chaperone HtpG|nr:ATP-binding protein [Zoogloeaceae bacterium]
MSPEPVPVLHRAGVDLSGLMSVLGKHLYSTPTVAIRELVQNAHDSIIRRRLEASGEEAGRIEVFTEPTRKIVRIVDNGAGLTEAEIHEYLATVGVGYTRKLRQQQDSGAAAGDDTGLIGMFGLGFLSAFVLARRVRVRTTSWQTPGLGHQYLSSHAEQYSVQPIPARAIGTEVELLLRDEFTLLANAAHLRDILGRYCALLREPIHIDGSPQPINLEAPPWRNHAAVAQLPAQARKTRLEFAARFEKSFAPIAVIDLPRAPDGDCDAEGLLWIQDGATYGTSDNRNLSVFLRGMLLDDDARDLLPPWAGFVGGVIESSRLTPTASREDLQRDAHYQSVQHALREALVAGLGEIARQEPEAWRRILTRHNEALLGASLCDERLFSLLMDKLSIPGTQGECAPRMLAHKGAIHVMLERDNDFESMLFRALGVPLAFGHLYAVLPFLRRYCAATGLRLVELGTEHGNRQLFAPATLSEAEQEDLAAHLADDDECLIPARFEPVDLPLIVVPDRDALLKRRLEEDARDKRVSTAALSLARQFAAGIDARHAARLYLNLDNPAIVALRETRRQGGDIRPAAQLLKAFKILGNARQQETGAEIGNALQALSAAVALLASGNKGPETITGENGEK